MLTFVVQHSVTRVENVQDVPQSFLFALNDYLSYTEQNFQYTWRYKNTAWNGKNYLLGGKWNKDIFIPSFSSLSFRSGLLKRVLVFCKQNDVGYLVADERTFPVLENGLTWQGSLRDYQEIAVDKFLENKKGILAAATGAGKSIIITNIVSRLNIPTVILCGTIDLVVQMKEHLEREIPGATIGMVGDGKCEIEHITVSTWQSAARSIDAGAKTYFYDRQVSEKFDVAHSAKITAMLKAAQLVVLDESHCARAKTIQIILRNINAPYVLGTSATPKRDEGDDLLIEAELGNIFYDISASALIKRGWLVRPTIEYNYIDNSSQRGEWDDFHAVYKQLIVNNDVRNYIIGEKARAMVKAGRKTLILVDHLEEHGKALEKMLSDIQAEFLNATLSSKKRQVLINAFRAGEIDCMIATSLADEGLDVPIMSGEILAGGKRGKTKTKQRVGRALRPYAEKADARIVDFIDDGKFVLDHSISRIVALKTEPAFNIVANNVPKERKDVILKKIEKAVGKIRKDDFDEQAT